MLEGAKSIGAGAATIASAGAAVGIGNVFSSFRGSKSFIGETIIWLCHFGLCSNRSYCIVCPNDGIFDPICILKEKMKKTWLILGYMIFFFLMRPFFRYLIPFIYISLFSVLLNGNFHFEPGSGSFAFHFNQNAPALESGSSSWKESSFEMGVLLESWPSSAAEAAPSVQAAPAEIDLFQRIRDLEAELAHGIPPQLNQGDYERQVREILANSVNPSHYFSNLSNEFFEVNMMQHKVQIQNRIFDTLITEPNIDRIITISPYPNIREEIFDFLESQVEPLNSMRHPFQKHLMEGTLTLYIRDLEQNGTGSCIYREFLSHFKDEKTRLLLGLPV